MTSGWPITGPLLACILLVPVVTAAEVRAASGGGFSFWNSLLQMAAALCVVLGVILLCYVVATRLMRRLPALGSGKRYIRIIETQAIGPRKALILVEAGGEYLLLSSCGDQLILIKQLDLIEDIEVVDEHRESPSFLSVLGRAGSIHRKDT